ncbi:MAG: acyl-CoA desaturase [Planctomycetaceae bacterium]|nr:acyl-CoA desaturase [Planctomycetaceae bacterium]
MAQESSSEEAGFRQVDPTPQSGSGQSLQVALNPAAAKVLRRTALVTVVLPFLGMLMAVSLLWQRWVYPIDLAVLAVMYALSIIGIGVGFHRLVTHRAFETYPPIKAVLCILGSMAAEGPVLFWASIHRRHHAASDREGDPHSPHLHGATFLEAMRGAWHAHVGWMFVSNTSQLGRTIPDLLQDRVLLRISRYYLVWAGLGILLPGVVEAMIVPSVGGFARGLLWGGFVRIFMVHHVSWSINSICHLFGTRPYSNSDHSTNNILMALLSFGEGWHNNHHAFPSSALHGLRWWQIDFSGYIIVLLRTVGLAWNVKVPTRTQQNSRYANQRPTV